MPGKTQALGDKNGKHLPPKQQIFFFPFVIVVEIASFSRVGIPWSFESISHKDLSGCKYENTF